MPNWLMILKLNYFIHFNFINFAATQWIFALYYLLYSTFTYPFGRTFFIKNICIYLTTSYLDCDFRIAFRIIVVAKNY